MILKPFGEVMTVVGFSPRVTSMCSRTMRKFFGSLLSAGSLKAAKLIGSVVPGPRTSGWPIVAAEAVPASAPVPAMAVTAAIEAVRRIVVERLICGDSWIREGIEGAPPGSPAAGPGGRPDRWRASTPSGSRTLPPSPPTLTSVRNTLVRTIQATGRGRARQAAGRRGGRARRPGEGAAAGAAG